MLTTALIRLLLLLCELLKHRLLHRIHLEGEHASQLPCGAAYRAAESGLSEDAANRATERLTDLPEQIAKEALRCELLHLLLLKLLCIGLLQLLHRIGLEGQQAAQLSGSTAYRTAESRLSEDATNRATQQLSYLSEQVTEEALRRHLLPLPVRLLPIRLLHGIHLEGKHASQLSGSTADRTTES